MQLDYSFDGTNKRQTKTSLDNRGIPKAIEYVIKLPIPAGEPEGKCK